MKRAAEDEARKISQEALDIEKRIAQKEESLDIKLTQITQAEKQLEEKGRALVKKEEDLTKIRNELIAKLSKVSSLTAEEAKKLILQNVEESLKTEIAKRIKEAQEKIKAESREIAKEILVNAMIAGATDWAAEYTVSTVKLESEDIKGRIIGKEGRNIRAFELATGVGVELESDVAGEVRLSSFDPVRREIAKIALEWLVSDARIQPSRIEQLVDKAKSQVESDMSEAGRRAAAEVGIYNIPQQALDTLGRLKFRYSYGQNQLIAAVETSKIAKKIALELGANAQICATGGLFHDIGKTEMEKEGTHVHLGIELAKKWNFPQEVIDCIAQHHEDEPFSSIESMIVHIADAVSGARPGARHEAVEDYIKRLSDIENIATSFSGVAKAYAIQAGREIRVIVQPDIVDDAGIVNLSHEIKQKLEDQLSYPGQITVTVIREVRAVDIAK
ncbi:ribonuclease Y [Candidatus Curtissbacteria bacterium RIFCSPLOWO2_01_FULL_38_11b]|uniref:Ribonuclease Y n=1 Tax=Candidatus Curtissbacteria bacterium RIFCSPLOWO2_01_FULL_38_11b TaxID=1797725 RepID=A0A1F5H0D1_9BACT|nr:MAG: ribonuclease Y [Candidatus Curtissbacteria bacterium RIFCSPLOWO2_01_FULL_38_11b]